MMDYQAPVADSLFALGELAELGHLADLPGFEEVSPDLVAAILEEAGKLAGGVLAPINHLGDLEGCAFENGVVRTPKGFPEAYKAFVEGGWNAVPFDPNFGGQGLPWAVAFSVQEYWNAANMSFALAPLLTQGAVELLQSHGSDEQKAKFLPKLISGEWTGTMNLTEPQAGSDVGAARTRAEPRNGHYLVSGQKIFITHGEHDMAENIVHMVLARTPDAPAGTRGISLFIVPKFLPDETGTPGTRNDLRCVSIEHKLGIKASPTCVMAFGEDSGAIGYLVGEENRGMEYMFTMMNNARIAVGVQGLAVADRAFQAARAYARERVQSRAVGSKDHQSVAIVNHPDVRRMLMTMRAKVEAMRGLVVYVGAALDRAKLSENSDSRAVNQATVDLLTPVIKAWSTDQGVEIASLAIQVHGGLGFIEETGVAQLYRDARIAPIYEGTNGIQALDLLGRKLGRDRGAAFEALTRRLYQECADSQEGHGRIARLAKATGAALEKLRSTGRSLAELQTSDPSKAAASASPFLEQFGTVAGAWVHFRQARAAALRLEEEVGGEGFLRAKIATAEFYAANILPFANALAERVEKGAESTLAIDPALI